MTLRNRKFLSWSRKFRFGDSFFDCGISNYQNRMHLSAAVECHIKMVNMLKSFNLLSDTAAAGKKGAARVDKEDFLLFIVNIFGFWVC